MTESADQRQPGEQQGVREAIEPLVTLACFFLPHLLRFAQAQVRNRFLNDALARGAQYSFQPRVTLQLAKHMLDMIPNGCWADVKFVGQLFRASAERERLQNRQLPGR